MLPIAILAGGLATRLRPITETIPKSLIKLAGKPFICHQLEYLQSQGITSIVLCVGFLGELIQDVVGDGARWGVQVSYSFDGPCLLGTGGAIRNAVPLLGEEFFVLYGDSYLPVDFSDIHNAYKKSFKLALMTILKNQDQWDKSNVDFSNGKVIEYNKEEARSSMHYIDYGLGIMRASTVLEYPKNQFLDLAKVYNDLSLSGHLAGYEVFNRFYEIGSHKGIVDTENYLLQNSPKGSL